MSEASYPVNLLFPWVLLAGRALSCAGCGARSTTPSPRATGFGQAIEGFLNLHKGCHQEACA